MANGVLLVSALCCGALHLWALLSFFALSPPSSSSAFSSWACALLGGICTSIWNHASTSELAKWLDRCVIACCVALDTFVLWATTHPDTHLFHLGVCYLALLCAVALYFAAKHYEHKCVKRRDACHAGSHVLATVLHVSMATLVLAPSPSSSS